MEPIGNLLKKPRIDLANLQDYLIEIIYNKINPNAILYGGTAIWRCYNGSRFSEDIDIYLSTDSLEKLVNSLPHYGLKLLSRNRELKSIITVSYGTASVLVEAKEGTGENTVLPYTRIDGSTMMVQVLSPTELMVRKVEAYQGRRYIRDIYDLFILTRFLDRHDFTVRSRLQAFLKNVEEPIDEPVLRSLIYSGKNDFTFRGLIGYIARWLNEV